MFAGEQLHRLLLSMSGMSWIYMDFGGIAPDFAIDPVRKFMLCL
jgi:hypothetical protein